MKRLAFALGALALLLVLTWTTISDEKLRLASTAVLALFGTTAGAAAVYTEAGDAGDLPVSAQHAVWKP